MPWNRLLIAAEKHDSRFLHSVLMPETHQTRRKRWITHPRQNATARSIAAIALPCSGKIAACAVALCSDISDSPASQLLRKTEAYMRKTLSPDHPPPLSVSS